MDLWPIIFIVGIFLLACGALCSVLLERGARCRSVRFLQVANLIPGPLTACRRRCEASAIR